MGEEKAELDPSNIGIGEVVEVRWHDKGEKDVVWHTKSDTGVVYRKGGVYPEDLKESGEPSEKLHSNIVLTYQTEGREIVESETLGDEDGAQVNEKLETAFEDISPFDEEEKRTVSSQTKNSASRQNESPVARDVTSVSSILDALDSLFTQKNTRPGEKKIFDPQELLTHIRYNPQYSVNGSWINAFESLSCDLQPFLQRWSMSGEFFST